MKIMNVWRMYSNKLKILKVKRCKSNIKIDMGIKYLDKNEYHGKFFFLKEGGY